MKTLPTWGGRSSFKYEGSVMEGTKFYFPTAPVFISAYDYYRMMVQFRGQTVNIGTSRTEPPVGSVGHWQLENVAKSNVMSFMGSVLVEEGFVEKAGGPDIRFRADCVDRFLEGVALEPLFHAEISSSYLLYDVLKRNGTIARDFVEWLTGKKVKGVDVAREKSYPGKGTVDLYFSCRLHDGSGLSVLIEVKVHDYVSATAKQLETYYRAAVEERADDVEVVYLTQLNREYFRKDWEAAEPDTLKEFEGLTAAFRGKGSFRHITWYDFYRFIEPYRERLTQEQQHMLQLQKKWMLSKTVADLEKNIVQVGVRDLVEFFDAGIDLREELPFGKEVSKNKRVNYIINLEECSEEQLGKVLLTLQRLAGSASIDRRPCLDTAEDTLEAAKTFLAELMRDEAQWLLGSFYASLFASVHQQHYLHLNGTGLRGFSIRATVSGKGTVSLCTLWANKTMEFSLKR